MQIKQSIGVLNVKKYKVLILMLMLLMIPSVLSASLNGSSSIYTFSVTNCIADEVQVGCEPETIIFSCDVTNKQFIDFIEFRIDGSLYNASFLGVTASVNFFKPNQTSTINTSILFDRILITDSNSDTAIYDESVSVLNDCLTCTDIGYSDSCSIFDNTTAYHIFEPLGCDTDFNETIICDYCEQDIEQILDDCTINDTQFVSYVDNNFLSCCFVTGISSDCSILSSPYNETGSQFCSYFLDELNCDFPSLTEFDNRMIVDCKIPLEYSDEDFSCVSKVYEDGRLVQVNPEYTDYGNSFLGLRRTEPKEFFTPDNRLLNVYFTKKNLLTEKDFVFEVACESDERTLVSGNFVQTFYKDSSWVANRIKWGKDNATYLIIALVMVVIIAGFVGLTIKKGRGNSR